MEHKKLDKVTLGGGCFWCIEAVFQEVKGVAQVVSGYTGGTAPGVPTYREICSGLTGHAEVIQISFDPNVIALQDLIIIFMTSHDPTTLNKQGADIGTQYRSVIYYRDEAQKNIITSVLAEVKKYYDEPIITEVGPLTKFHKAEEHHQDYYKNNSTQGYCSYVIAPKLNKLRQLHADKLK